MTGSEDDLGASIITQMFDLWVDAELQRRGASRGDVFAALVELPPHGVPIVRINEEVVLAARASKDSGITSGTPVTSENIDSLEDVWPTNIGPDSGWTLFYLLGDAAQVAFDFRYNKGQANRLLDLARDYLLTSRTMVSTAIGPAVDSLYSAAELTVQVQMLSQAQRTRVHQARGEWLQANEDLGNTPQGFSAVLQRLRAERAAARYGDGTVTVTSDEMTVFMDTIDEVIEFARGQSERALFVGGADLGLADRHLHPTVRARRPAPALACAGPAVRADVVHTRRAENRIVARERTVTARGLALDVVAIPLRRPEPVGGPRDNQQVRTARIPSPVVGDVGAGGVRGVDEAFGGPACTFGACGERTEVGLHAVLRWARQA
ncbi:hypothetical protein [Microbacterium sp. K35]|uniref:hypothetical protein n=1 Tax=Microbacterium sp. K35 TaxID=2305440 RepID=UPI001F1183B0|nr:hypothetical protein [Microbacterium sp. K35]